MSAVDAIQFIWLLLVTYMAISNGRAISENAIRGNRAREYQASEINDLRRRASKLERAKRQHR